MRRKTLIAADFIITTVLQEISYPAIALADNKANTTEQESVHFIPSSPIKLGEMRNADNG